MPKIKYDSSFSIKGGIETKQSWKCANTPSVKVKVSITNNFFSRLKPDLAIHLRKKGLLGFHTVDEGRVSINDGGGTVNLEGNGKGEYQIYFRHYVSEVVEANFTVTLQYDDSIH